MPNLIHHLWICFLSRIYLLYAFFNPTLIFKLYVLYFQLKGCALMLGPSSVCQSWSAAKVWSGNFVSRLEKSIAMKQANADSSAKFSTIRRGKKKHRQNLTWVTRLFFDLANRFARFKQLLNSNDRLKTCHLVPIRHVQTCSNTFRLAILAVLGILQI